MLRFQKAIERYSKVMEILKKHDFSESSMTQFTKAFESITHAAPEVIHDKAYIFALVCIDHQQEFIEKNIDVEIQQILTSQ